MSNRSFDVVILGASGFVGSSIVKYIYKNSLYSKWAIVGRTHQKLSLLINELIEMKIPGSILPSILIADALDIRTVIDILYESILLINCLSPVSLFKDIVDACIVAECHYMDLCSDSYLIENHYLEYHQEAEKKGIFILHGFGFDPGMTDLSILYLRNNMIPGSLNSIESYFRLDTNSPKCQRQMIDSILSNGKHMKQLKKLQTKIIEQYDLPPTIYYPGPQIELKFPYYFDKRLKVFATPSLGPEQHIISHFLRYVYLREPNSNFPQFKSYFISDNYYTISSTSFYTSFLSSLSLFSFGRTLIRTFPDILTEGVISSKKPTVNQIQNGNFTLYLHGKGYLPMNHPFLSNLTSSPQQGFTSDDISPIVVQGWPISNLSKNNLDETPNKTNSCHTWTSNNKLVQEEFNHNLSNKSQYERLLKISGPEPYCVVSTILIARLSSLFLKLKKSQNTTIPFGGVHTPSSLFVRHPQVFDTLKDAGITFQFTTFEKESIPIQSSSPLMSDPDMLDFENLPVCTTLPYEDEIDDCLPSEKTVINESIDLQFET